MLSQLTSPPITVNPAEDRHGPIVILVAQLARKPPLQLSIANSPKLMLLDVIPKAQTIDFQLQVNFLTPYANEHVWKPNLNLNYAIDSEALAPRNND